MPETMLSGSQLKLIWHYLKKFFLSQVGRERDCLLPVVGRAKDAAKYPIHIIITILFLHLKSSVLVVLKLRSLNYVVFTCYFILEATFSLHEFCCPHLFTRKVKYKRFK